MSTRISPGLSNSLQISQLEERQAPKLSQFLAGVFGSDTAPAFLDPQLAHWKYFEPHPEWEGTRSYVIEQAEAIVAHASIWPAVFACSSTEVRCVHILDWAGSRSVAGAATAIYQHLMGLGDAAFVVGGSDQAKRLLPRMGFQLHGTQNFYAKVVRPWMQFKSRPRTSWGRDVGRLARNAVWSVGNVQWPVAWSAKPVAATGHDFSSSWKPQPYCRGKRTAAVIDYLLRCPIVNNRLFEIENAGATVGYFILNTFEGQCRIVDLFIDSEDRQAWRSAYCVALLTASRIRSTCEVVATASLPWLGEILETLGLRLRDEKPIFLYDPKKRCAGLSFLIQMVDSDAFFLHSPSYPYLT